MKLFAKFGVAMSAFALSAFVACDNSSSSDDNSSTTTVKEQVDKLSKAIGLNLPKCEKDGQSYNQELYGADMDFKCANGNWKLTTSFSEISKTLDREALAIALEDSGFDLNDFLKAFEAEMGEKVPSKPGSGSEDDDELDITIDKCKVTATSNGATITMASTGYFTSEMSFVVNGNNVTASATIDVLNPIYAAIACQKAKEEAEGAEVTCTDTKVSYSTTETVNEEVSVDDVKAEAELTCAAIKGEINLDDLDF